MGALLQPRLDRVRKQPTVETVSSRLDQYGRDPESPAEKLRAQTDYDSDTGYSPMYHAALADLPRLCGGSAVAYAFVLVVNMLSYGRPRSAKDARPTATLQVTTDDLAVLCRSSVRDIQRQIDEMESRGMISVRRPSRGKYVISLLYRKWRELDDYAVWKRKQVVAIDSAADDETEADEEPLPVSHDAVRLVRSPQSVRPGRASRAVKVGVGVKELSFQNDSPNVDAMFDAVVQSGRLVVSARLKKTSETESSRHGCREIPTNEGNEKAKKPEGAKKSHPREADVIKVFTPLLQSSGARPLSTDRTSLLAACEALGDWPTHELVRELHSGASPRASRPVSSPKHVASIIKDCKAAAAGGPPLVSKPRGAVKDAAEELKDYAVKRFNRDGDL